MANPLVMIDGTMNASLNTMDRGLLYGHGLFETIRVVNGRLPLLDYHLTRLTRDAPQLSIGIPDTALLRDQIVDLLMHASDQWQCDRLKLQANLKILVTAGFGGRGYRTSGELKPCVILQLFERHLELPTKIRVKVCSATLATSSLGGIKHCNRLEQVLAARELDDGQFFEGLMGTEQGFIIEGVTSNVFVLSNAKMSTPVVERCGVAGVMRQYLLDHAYPSLDIAILPVSVDSLTSADQLFIVNSNWGVLAVDELTVGSDLVCFPRTAVGDTFVALGEQAFVPTDERNIESESRV